MEQQTIETVITKDNFEEIFERLIVGNIRAQNYTSDCFGMSDLRFARYTENALSQMFKRTIAAGYCHHNVLGPLMKKYDYPIITPKRPELKQEIDEDFRVDMSDFQRAIATGYYVFDSTLELMEEGCMKYR